MKKILSLIFLSSLVSCISNNDSLTDSTIEKVITGHEIAEIIIEIDSLSLSPKYYQHTDTYYDGTSVIMYGYNKKTHSLDIFDILAKKIENHIMLEREGPNGIGDIMGFGIISSDSILIADYKKFCIINKDGDLIWKLDRNEDYIFENIPEGELFLTSGFKPKFNQRTNVLTVYYAPNNREKAGQYPLMVEIDIQNKKSTFIDFYYPDNLKKIRHLYNPIPTGPRTCFVGDSVIINFANSSDIFSLNLTTGVSRLYSGASNYVNSFPPPMEKGANPLDYALSSARFFKLTYDPYRDVFFRTQWGEMELRKDGYEFNTYDDKPIYLSVFDINLNVIYETHLSIENRICPEILIPTPKGLVVFQYKQNQYELENDTIKGNLVSFKY